MGLSSGSKVDLIGRIGDWVQYLDRSILWVLFMEHVDVFEYLRFLVKYSHGCVE